MDTENHRAFLRKASEPRSLGRDRHPPLLAERIEHVAIDHIKPYEANPREHDDRQITKLAGIISSVGFLVPILVDDQNIIIAGHGRWAAARQLELRSIPVIRASHLTAPQIKAFRLADNRIGELSSWNRTALAHEFKALIEAIDLDPEILELTAFEIPEIDLHIESLDEIAPAPERADRRPDGAIGNGALSASRRSPLASRVSAGAAGVSDGKI